jgi:hypothetical protein
LFIGGISCGFTTA